jgi:hypothetical protein
MTPVIQYTRLTHADKLSDRFITSQVYRPADPESQREGVIFSQIEILNPWLPATQIGQTIINTAIREYYRAGDTSELNNFEIALKKVNETLAQITQSGETEWIGKLNGVLVLINNQDIHISQTGQTQGYLFRGAKINHITEGLDPSNEPHPLKTFSNITSGTLEPRDKVVIANAAFYEAITLDQVKEIITNAVPALAAEEFARMLKREKKMHAEALILEMTTREDVASMPPECKIDTVYLDRKVGIGLSGLKDSLRRIGKPVFGVILTGTSRVLKKADHHFETHVVPTVKKTSARAYHFSRRLTAKAINKVRHQKIHHHSDEATTPNVQLPPAATKITRPISQYSKVAWQWFGKKFSFTGDGESQNKARRYGIWGAALLIVLIILIITGRHTSRENGQPTGNLQQLSSTLGDKFNRVKLLSAYNDKPAAIKELADIIGQIQDAEGKQTLPSSLQELKKQAVSELAALTDSTQIKNAETLAAWGNRNFVVTLGDQTIAVNNQKLTIIPGDIDADLSPLNNIQAVAADTDNKKIYLLGGSGLWQFKTDDKSLTQIKIASGEWPDGVSLKVFTNNLYLLDAVGNQILKYIPKDDGYSVGAPYSQPEGQELNSAVDIAINGSVLALLKNSQVIKYTKTGREAIGLIAMPAENFIKTPARIFAHTDSQDIALVHDDLWLNDTTRLSIFTRAGRYKKSFLLPSDKGKVQTVDFDIKQGILTVVTDQEIYRANTSAS